MDRDREKEAVDFQLGWAVGSGVGCRGGIRHYDLSG